MTERRRLFLDVETSPLQVFVWSLNDKANSYISHKSIIKDRGIICICWKWAGEEKIESLTWNKSQNDKAMLKKFVTVMDSATEICAHNLDRFDLPWLRGRCLIHGIPMAPTYPTVDTLKKARAKFRLPSNRLDYLGGALVGEQKIATGFGLWRDIVLDKSETAMRKMVDYCKQDVALLEKVYDKMAPYIEPVTSVADYTCDCPECGNPRYYVKGYRTRKTGSVWVQLLCKECPKWKWYGVPLSKFKSNKKLAAA
jgi:DNA polymerase elongation subunit (family B)